MTEHSSDGYEKKDVNILKITLVSVLSVAFLAIILILLNDYFVMSKEALYQEVVLNPKSLQLREIRAAEDERLLHYKTIDAAKDMYQIPIDRAMQLIADEDYQIRRK